MKVSKSAVFVIVMLSTFAGGGALAQPTEFIIGGDFLGGVVMLHNGAALAPGFLETLAGAGFTHLFLFVDTASKDAKNQESASILWQLRGRDLAPGLYFVHVRTSTQKAVLRILLEPVPGSR